ncbi:hypothetical protein LCGC14_0938150 [marine sediment metagenome]|uniref:Uncharacterized protein n=1 Tax=marine sediment metagenome TaxID=412755 RepID=A0A0F9NQI2_9ZZZZ
MPWNVDTDHVRGTGWNYVKPRDYKKDPLSFEELGEVEEHKKDMAELRKEDKGNKKTCKNCTKYFCQYNRVDCVESCSEWEGN